MDIKRVEEFALANGGYNIVVPGNHWKGREVYEVGYDPVRYVGYPRIICVDGEDIYLASVEESWQYYQCKNGKSPK